MCQQHQSQGHDGSSAASSQSDTNSRPHYNDPFPWHLGAFDAHCHPTDTMSSIASLATLNARVLAIMATRSQDQHLVAQVAAEHGVSDSDSPLNYEGISSSDSGDLASKRTCKVVPAFGWHPWFSYQLYDDTASNSNSENASSTEDAFKIAHYKAVLQPTPKDPTFLSSSPSNPLILIHSIHPQTTHFLPPRTHRRNRPRQGLPSPAAMDPRRRLFSRRGPHPRRARGPAPQPVPRADAAPAGRFAGAAATCG